MAAIPITAHTRMHNLASSLADTALTTQHQLSDTDVTTLQIRPDWLRAFRQRQ